MQEARKMLSLGMQPHIAAGADPASTYETAPAPVIVDMDRLIPEDHRYFLRVLDADIDTIVKDIRDACRGGDTFALIKASKRLSEVHPFFAINGGFGAGAYTEATAELICEEPEFAEVKESGFVERIRSIFGDVDFSNNVLWYSDAGNEEALYGSLFGFDAYRKRLKTKMMLLLGSEDIRGHITAAEGFDVYRLTDSGKADNGFMPEIGRIKSRLLYHGSEAAGYLSAAIDFDDTGDIAAMVSRALDDFARTENADSLAPILNRLLLYRDEDTDAEGFGGLTEVYDTLTIEELLELEFYMLMTAGCRVRRCKRCGLFYIVRDGDEGFCRVADNKEGISCYGVHIRSMLKTTVDKIYNRAYKTHFARIKAGTETKEAVNNWREAARKLQEDIWKEKITPAQYQEMISKRL